jgi:hypothetical protein
MGEAADDKPVSGASITRLQVLERREPISPEKG